MFTLGYSFRPWTDPKAIADGDDDPAATSQDTAREYGVERHIRFQHRVVRADWSSADARWTVHRPAHRHRRDRRADLLVPVRLLRLLPLRRGLHARRCRGATRTSPGRWCTRSTGPRTSTHAGKRVVVDRQRRHRRHAGAGAGASGAAHVTMLQRSPSYVMSLPARDPLADALRRRLPREGRVSGRAVEERAAVHASSSSSAAARPGWCSGLLRRAARRQLPVGLRRRHALLAAATTRGTSGCAWCPTATCSRPSRRAGRRWSPTASTRFTAHGVAARRPAPSCPPTSSSPRPGSTCWPLGGMTLRVDGEPRRPGETASPTRA